VHPLPSQIANKFVRVTLISPLDKTGTVQSKSPVGPEFQLESTPLLLKEKPTHKKCKGKDNKKSL